MYMVNTLHIYTTHMYIYRQVYMHMNLLRMLLAYRDNEIMPAYICNV